MNKLYVNIILNASRKFVFFEVPFTKTKTS